MNKLYVIAGCNGAGKTTASYTILPELLNCKEFVNADEIARGLSPFQPEKAGIEAGRLMLERTKKLLELRTNFAFETTLATRSYAQLIKIAKMKGYEVTLLFFWLASPSLALQRVKRRVEEGGHNIPEEIIKRRYKGGLKNFFNLYMPILDNWMFINNSGANYEIVAEGYNHHVNVNNSVLWNSIKKEYHEH
ncbi:MAG: zeta toxin family protein [Bacteroidota bacterium]